MVIMAGMLPGVECARRRRLRQGAAAEAPSGGTRRATLCLYAGGGRDPAHLSASAASKGRSGACKEEMARAWTLDSNAREAKERLDQKLRDQRESVVVKRHQSTGTKPHATSTSDGTASSSKDLHHTATALEAGATPPCVLQREVFSEPKSGGCAARRRRFSCCLLGRRRPASPAEAEAWECAVCLEELRGGDVVAHLPCGHRFHWSCAVPWVQAASRCPVCRAQVHLACSSPS